ncbi:helix-turn-helix domain-containing protein [Streptomyces verrucosisporus]|uniref:helix-turn-helix domain-containing protein n=1 Tax=Streptomyces verrucosisporus TaxID=1695161 RepID=UPI0019D30F64|nr:helix-turn-helix domain-containing protein [Streptomyces verrucosisporus]MBN3928748.1 helix-turn-helix domain-containing protein [Streptomyces verrucosisporus]
MPVPLTAFRRLHRRTSQDEPSRSAGIEQEYAAARLRFEPGGTARGRRLELGLSQGGVGRRARVTQSAVARLEAGGTVPTLPVPARLAEAL